MQEPDNQAAASDVNAAETPEERDTSEVSVVPYMRIIPELPPLPHPPPFQELPTLPNPLAIPELSPLPQLSLVPSLRAFVASTEDTEELPPMRVVWLTSETETTAECPQPPDQSMPHTPEEETFDILKWRLSAQLECLLCIEIMMPPIVFCKNGHMICSKCGPKLEKCPLCRYSKTSLIRLQLIWIER
jgi:hypothetical protein